MSGRHHTVPRPRTSEDATPQQIRRQRSRALAQHLKKLAHHFPEFGHLMELPISVLLYQSNRALVLHAIHMGAWRVRDIQTETKLPVAEVRRLLEALVQSKIIFTTTRNEGEGGRPEILYLPHPNSNP